MQELSDLRPDAARDRHWRSAPWPSSCSACSSRIATPGADYVSGWLAVIVLVVAAGLVVYRGDAREVLFEGAFISDAFSRFSKLLVLAGAALVLVMSFDSLARAKLLTAEFCVLTLLAVTGMLLMVSAGNLIALFLGLELQSLALYVIAAIDRNQVRSSEAGLKYFVLGSLSSGMLLYGASLIYGFTGSIDLAVIATVAQGQPAAQNIGLIVGLVFLLVGLAFKVGAVPFHMWTPDVYEGAPTPVTAFFAAAPKLAAMALLVRTLLQGFPGIAAQWQQIIVFLSIASMLLGAFAAIGQRNIKRLMAYSSIGHIGYALIGLAANSEAGTQSVLVYLAIYLAMTVGTFACILSMRTAEGPVEDIDALSGLAKTNLSMAFVLAMLLFSMAGIPAARRLLRQAVRVRRGDQSRPRHARRHRRAGERRRRLLLPAPRQDHVLRRRQGGVPARRSRGRRRHGAVRRLRAAVRAGAGAARQCGADRGARAARRHHRCHPMTQSPAGCRRAASLSTSTRSTAPMRRRCAACWPASAARMWVIAQRQTAGRGRSGRAWSSQPGNLFASFITALDCPPAKAGQLSLVAGIAVIDAIRRAGDVPGLRLKWPNDILVGTAKTGGILVESTSRPPQPGPIAVIGVGLNLVSAPDDLGRAATFLAQHGLALSPREALCFLAQTMSDWIGIWNNGEGFAPVREAWLARAGSLGEALTVNAAGGPVTGIVCRHRRQRRAAHRRRRRPPAQLLLRRRFARRERYRRMIQQQRSAGRVSGGDELVFLALGGLGEIGMNAYLYGFGPEDARRWLMVDCGITFPEGENDPGIDVILPDVRFIEEHRADLAGIVITHAHEDHIGAVIELWPRLRAPVYATPFTAGMLKAKLAEYGNSLQIPIHVVAARFQVRRRPLRRRAVQPGALHPGNERAGHPHAARHRVPHRRLEARPDADHRRAGRCRAPAEARR